MDNKNIRNLNGHDDYSSFLNNIISSSDKETLFFFIGAGVSISQGYPTWNEYVDELIDYWKYHLIDLCEENDGKHSETLNQIKLLTQLKNSNMSKKRKIDFVNLLIKKFCSELENDSYKSKVLNFEKFLFSKVKPIDVTNDILDELMNIRASFITTNYDDQIEKSFDKKFSVRPQIVSDLSANFNNNGYEKVIHLHGLPTSNPDFFINSAVNYSNIYFGNQYIYKNKFQKLFEEKKNITIVFVGCSMEEDEVLSLFNLNDNNFKYYALMKFNEEKGELSDFTKDYYRLEKNINFLWYGYEFKDLPQFLNKLNDDISLKKINELNKPDKVRKVMLGLEDEDERNL